MESGEKSVGGQERTGEEGQSCTQKGIQQVTDERRHMGNRSRTAEQLLLNTKESPYLNTKTITPWNIVLPFHLRPGLLSLFSQT